MAELDRELASSAVSIPRRPLHVLAVISERYHVTLDIAPGAIFQEDVPEEKLPIPDRVHLWYERRYGERVKTNFSPGRMVILIEEDLWTIRFGRIFGRVAFTVSRTFRSERLSTNGSPVKYNVLDAVEEMPPTRWRDLPDDELEHIYHKFMLGMEAFSWLEGSSSLHPLIESSASDVSTAVERLMAQPGSWGLSKWASLQASEKVMKAVISLRGNSYPTNHNLSDLVTQVCAGEARRELSALIEPIQCSPGIRYGEEKCSRDEALLAHTVSLGLIVTLGRTTNHLQSSLELQQTHSNGG